MADKKIAKGLTALRSALATVSDEGARQALLSLADMLAKHKGVIAAAVEASEKAKQTRLTNLHAHITDEAAAALAAATRALSLAGVSQLLEAIANDAAIDAVGTDGMLRNKSIGARDAAHVGAALGLEAQMRALPIGIMATPAGERSISIIRDTLRQWSEEPEVSPAPKTLTGDPEYDALPDHPYEPPEMTDELAAAIARDVARIMILGDEAVTGYAASDLRDMKFAIRCALWHHGFMTEQHHNRESFRRRLYRSGKANQNDPALLAFEAEKARLEKARK